MGLLLDTHVLLWWLSDSSKLSSKARSALESDASLAYISSATVWEIRIKEALGKIQAPQALLEVISKQGFIELPITWEHANVLRALEGHHKDPFDRILIAQARTEKMRIVTADGAFASYGVSTLW